MNKCSSTQSHSCQTGKDCCYRHDGQPVILLNTTKLKVCPAKPFQSGHVTHHCATFNSLRPETARDAGYDRLSLTHRIIYYSIIIIISSSMTIPKDNGTFRLESIITSILHRTTSQHFILFLSILSTFELQRIVLFIIVFLFY